MKDAQKPDHISLNTIVARLREGRFVIPDFQREFEWKPWDIRDLMRSIFLDYYIGSLLLWKGKKENFKALSCEPIYGSKGDATPEYIVLDGQQRLTAVCTTPSWHPILSFPVVRTGTSSPFASIVSWLRSTIWPSSGSRSRHIG
jgi:Protein of unknown function DUF262